MFKLALGLQPGIIGEIFSKNEHYNRNLNLVVEKTPYIYLDKNAPVSLVKIWNSLNIAHRNWVKEVPARKDKKCLNSPPEKIPEGNNNELNNYRLNGFKKSLSDKYLANYKKLIKCNNRYCNDCTRSK